MLEGRAECDEGGKPRVSALAVWSLVCGAFFFLPPLSLVAVILSYAADQSIQRSKGRLVGYRIARVGRWLAVVSLILTCIIVCLILPSFSRARESSYVPSCMGNLMQIGLALEMYEGDYASNGHGQMPPDLQTLARLGYARTPPWAKNIFLCPAAAVWRGSIESTGPPGGEPCDYAYAHLVDPDSAPPDAPIMWDKYLHTERRFWHWTGRPFDETFILRADFHTSWIPLADLKASLEHNRSLYDLVPPLPVVGGIPHGWDPIEYLAALAVLFYASLILVALLRREWIYALLPDEP